MSLTVPRAPSFGVRAASPRVEENRSGEVIAQFGMTMLDVGQRMAAEQEQRGLGRARVEAMQGLNDIQLKYQQIGDPDEIDQGFTQDRQALRDRVIASLPESAQGQAGQMFDEMALPHAARLGGRAIELRQGQELATISAASQEIIRAGSVADSETQAAYRAQFDQQLQSAVARGVMSPEAAERARQSLGSDMDSARAQRMLSEDPASLVASIDSGEFGNMAGDSQQGWRARGMAAVETANAKLEAEAARARANDISAAESFFRDGIGVLGKGQPFSGAVQADQLLKDPEIAALPAAREYQATVALTQERPQLAVLPVAEKRTLLAQMEKEAVGKPYEADKAAALRKMITDDEKGFREDPLTYAARLGLKPAPDLPNPETSDSDALIAGLRARGQYSASLAQSGYTDQPKFFTPAEREQWTKLTAPTASPETRARLASDLASALGPAAEDAAAELGADPVFSLVGGGLSHGLQSTTAKQIFEGLRIIEGQQVKLPAKAERRQAFFGEFDSLFFDGTVDGWPDQSRVREQISGAADALYAYRMRSAQAEGGGKDGEIEESAYLQAVHEVMGGSGNYDTSRARGGVQNVHDRLTVLPSGVSADDVEDRLHRLGVVGGDMWKDISVSGASPLVGGEPPDARSVGRMQLRAVGPDQYIMVWPNKGTGSLTVLQTDSGEPYVLSMQALMRRAAEQ